MAHLSLPSLGPPLSSVMEMAEKEGEEDLGPQTSMVEL